MDIQIEGFRYSIASLRFFTPVITIILSIVICQYFYDKMDKKVFWVVGFISGLLAYFLTNLAFLPMDWWVLN